jgi:hypothetical protein
LRRAELRPARDGRAARLTSAERLEPEEDSNGDRADPL